MDERPYYEVEVRPEGAIVRRTSRPYLAIAEVAPSFAALDRELAGVPRTARLLVDLRAIVGRNDAPFESALAPLRRALLTKFDYTGLLVRSKIGHLQLQRYLAADGVTAVVFSDEAEAMAWFCRES